MDVLCSALFSMQSLFLGLSCSFGLPACCQRSFRDDGIGFTIRNSASCYDLLTTSLFAISIWWILEAHILRYLVVSVYPMNILLQVLYILDLERFSDRICILTLLSNIWICSRFYLTSVQAFSGMIIVISTIHLVDN